MSPPLSRSPSMVLRRDSSSVHTEYTICTKSLRRTIPSLFRSTLCSSKYACRLLKPPLEYPFAVPRLLVVNTFTRDTNSDTEICDWCGTNSYVVNRRKGEGDYIHRIWYTRFPVVVWSHRLKKSLVSKGAHGKRLELKRSNVTSFLLYNRHINTTGNSELEY